MSHRVRRVAPCVACGAAREIMGHGRCVPCYWRARRGSGRTGIALSRQRALWMPADDAALVAALLDLPTPALVGAATWAEAEAWLARERREDAA